MRFTIGKYDYSIEFEYGKDDNAWSHSLVINRNSLAVNRTDLMLIHPNITTCRILRGLNGAKTSDMEVYLEGKAARSVLDKFIKEKGRKAALTHALARSSPISRRKPEKAFRQQVWNAFLGRNGRKTPSLVITGHPSPNALVLTK